MLHKSPAIFLVAALICVAILNIFPAPAAQAEALWLFQPAATYNYNMDFTTTFGLAIADFNGDGKPDVATADYEQDNVHVLFNHGNSTLLPVVTCRVGSGAHDVAMGDFNGDGKPDLVSANYLADSVSLLLNNGNGTFQTQVKYSVGGSPFSISVGDFNNDGNADLVTANINNDTVSVLLNNGSGGFLSQTSYGIGSGTWSVTVGDLNGDDNLDIVTANNDSDDLSILLNNGSGGFQPQISYSVDNSPLSVTIDDFDDDGNNDMAIAGHYLIVLINDGNGAFLPRGNYDTSSASWFTAVGDFNSDGKPDLAAGATVLLNEGGGTFQRHSVYPLVDGNTYNVAVSDINGDSLPDLVITHIGRISVLLHTNRECLDGAFAQGTVYNAITWSVAAGDFNGDAMPDLIGVGNNKVYVLLNSGSGSFQTLKEYDLGFNSSSFTVGDFNHDHMPDLVVVRDLTTSVSILLNNGSGVFLPSTSFNIGAYFDKYLAVGDFNKDGNSDLVAVNSSSNSVSVLVSSGSGDFLPEVSYNVGNLPTIVAVGDYNRDGKSDLATSNRLDDTVSVLLNNGSGTFQPQVRYSVGDYPSSIAAGDLNGDGYTDLATANTDSNNISVLLNNGSGGFQTKMDFDAYAGPSAIVMSDFNIDGKPDLATAEVFSGTVSLLFNDGSGTFQWQGSDVLERGPFITYPRAMAVADFNSDGGPDLVTVNRAGNKGTTGWEVLLNRAPLHNTMDIYSVNSGPWDSPTTWNCRVPTANDSVTIDPEHTVTLSVPAEVKNLTINGTLAVSKSSPLTISGDWDITGSFSPEEGTLIFNGSGIQTLKGDTAFHNLVVGSNSIITTSANVTLNGTLTNHGWISETKAINSGTATRYGLGDVTVELQEGSVGSLRVMRRDTDHPNGPAGRQTGRYWSLTSNAGYFRVKLTLPTSFTPTYSDQVCRYTGTDWNCSRAFSTTSSITRTSVTQFSDWTILRSVPIETSTKLTANWNPSRYGQSVSFSATVSSGIDTPTGTVTFFDGDKQLGSAALNDYGRANYSTSALSVGEHTITARYTGEGLFPPSSATPIGQQVSPATLYVTAANAWRPYGSPNPGFTYTATGFENNENMNVLSGSPSISTAASQSSSVGGYTITISKGSLSSANYNLLFMPGKLSVTTVELIVSAQNTSKVYGSSNPAFTYSVTGFVNSENLNVLRGSPSITSTASQFSAVGAYPITITYGDLSSMNYSFTFVNGTLTITGNRVFLPAIQKD